MFNSNYTFPTKNFPAGSEPSYDYLLDTSHIMETQTDVQNFKWFDDHMIMLAAADDGTGQVSSSNFTAHLLPPTPAVVSQQNLASNVIISNTVNEASCSIRRDQDGGAKRTKMEQSEPRVKDGGYKISFRTKSAIDVMDDGFKWRKYGKKILKANPNPRSYYRCATSGCNEKKRIERDKEDSSYVITTYEGLHNHECPTLMYNREAINLGGRPFQYSPWDHGYKS